MRMSQLRRNAVLLSDESLGVATETDARKIQEKSRNRGFYCTINQDWLADLNLDEQGEATVHSKSMGMRPVIVQNPAIIIQPASVLEADSGDDNGGGGLW